MSVVNADIGYPHVRYAYLFLLYTSVVECAITLKEFKRFLSLPSFRFKFKSCSLSISTDLINDELSLCKLVIKFEFDNASPSRITFLF